MVAKTQLEVKIMSHSSAAVSWMSPPPPSDTVRTLIAKFPSKAQESRVSAAALATLAAFCSTVDTASYLGTGFLRTAFHIVLADFVTANSHLCINLSHAAHSLKMVILLVSTAAFGFLFPPVFDLFSSPKAPEAAPAPALERREIECQTDDANSIELDQLRAEKDQLVQQLTQLRQEQANSTSAQELVLGLVKVENQRLSVTAAALQAQSSKLRETVTQKETKIHDLGERLKDLSQRLEQIMSTAEQQSTRKKASQQEHKQPEQPPEAKAPD